MPAKTAQMTGFEANCLAAADHFIACRGSNPATRIRSFEPGDRYRYDFGPCSCARGWAQVDTAQDASWFGTWASLAERTILNFAEGDATRTVCDTDAEFVAALREIDRWNRDHGYGPARIDPGFDPALKAALEAVGLGDMLH